jgi:hypothetical protein
MKDATPVGLLWANIFSSKMPTRRNWRSGRVYDFILRMVETTGYGFISNFSMVLELVKCQSIKSQWSTESFPPDKSHHYSAKKSKKRTYTVRNIPFLR